MEAKLEQYRLRKRRKQTWESFKDRIKDFIMPTTAETSIEIDSSTTTEERKVSKTPESEKTLIENQPLIPSDDEECVTPPSATDESKLYKYSLRVVFFLFWATLYIIAIELKFGIVYLMISALIGICLNTRTGPKKAGEISAYSVFNENCEAIDGTLKAEQFEKELFYGGVRK